MERQHQDQGGVPCSDPWTESCRFVPPHNVIGPRVYTRNQRNGSCFSKRERGSIHSDAMVQGTACQTPALRGSPAARGVWDPPHNGGPDVQRPFSKTELFRDLRESETFSVLLVSLSCLFSVPGPREHAWGCLTDGLCGGIKIRISPLVLLFFFSSIF